MKKRITILSLVLAGLSIGGTLLFAADHIDAPAVEGTTADITDFYAFENASGSNMVLVANLQGLLSPTMTASARFDESVIVEFNIDNNGDLVEDLVIPVTFVNGQAVAYGPYAPLTTGTSTTINYDAPKTATSITPYGAPARTGLNNGIQIFAGPRDDPFFFDFVRYTEIIGGMASGFNNPGDDTFAGSNVMSCVLEVPKSKLGGSMLNIWVEAKRSN